MPITATYKFCGYDILPDFGIFDIFKHNVDIAGSLAEYPMHLERHCCKTHPGNQKSPRVARQR